MGKTILTARQYHFLELASNEEEIIRWYYLTGGTALSEFYLQHRLSDDIDLFTTSDVNDREIDKIINKAIKKLNALSFTKRRISGLFIYELKFVDGVLKIDFNSFPYESVEHNRIKFGNLTIDSYFDIAINKLYTVIGRFQTRDFIDLYFILKKKEFTLEGLIKRTEDKYCATIDTLYLSNQFLRSIDLPPAIPKMLVPFDFEEMKKFFVKKAKELGEKSFI